MDPAIRFVKSLFKSYYSSASCKLKPPSNLDKREFAFLFFDRGEMIRHVGFHSEEKLRSFIKSGPPSHIYYSSAYYLTPEEKDMDLKGWMGADLVFDIDSDHLPTPCKEKHDKWTCLDCGFVGKGLQPERCPNCEGRRLKSESFYLCRSCLEAAKDEVFKLVEEFLMPDFGFSSNEIHLAFSGRRGYHLHVESEAVKELDQYARREVVDYVKAVSIKPEVHGFHLAVKGSYTPPSLDNPGWRGRIARGIYSFLSRASLEDLVALLPPSRRHEAEAILASKDILLKAIESSPPRWAALLKYGRRFWEGLIAKAVELQHCEIDERVTTDIRRLIRMPGSLHGATGLIAMPLTLNELDTFDPLRDAVAFREGEVKVYVEEAPEISLMEMSFGPYKNSKVRLPSAVALYLLRAGLARLV